MWLRALMVAGIVVACVLSFLGGLLAGLVAGNGQAYHLRFLEEQRAVNPIVAAEAAFAGVEIRERSNGGVYLLGKVPTAGDLNRLRERVERALGELRCQEAMHAVGVKR